MKKKLLRIGIAILICLLIGFLSSITIQSTIETWYTSLNKPTFAPSNSFFISVWFVLYVLLGISAGIVWSKGFYHKWVKVALYHFGFQLLLSAAWPIFFFGMHNLLIALLDIVALLILLLFTIKWFTVVNSTAAYLLIPYVIWVAFVTALNFGIWQLN